MKQGEHSWPVRFFRWLFRAPFEQLPPQFGNTVPPELQVFEAQADEAEHQGLGAVAAGVPAHHAHVKPARYDGAIEALERQ